jgi:fatty-acid desaturase
MDIYVGQIWIQILLVQLMLQLIVVRFQGLHNRVIVMQLFFHVCSLAHNVNYKQMDAHLTLMEEELQILKL